MALLITGAVDLDAAAQIVESQLAEPSVMKPPGIIANASQVDC